MSTLSAFLIRLRRAVHSAVGRFRSRRLGPPVYHPDVDEIVHEKQPLQTWVKNVALFNPIVEMVDKFLFVRRRLRSETVASRRAHMTHASVLSIPEFLDFYSIDLSEFTVTHPLQYRSFNDFFTRTLKPGIRRPDGEPRAITAVADARALAFDNITRARELYFKAPSFSLESLTAGLVDVTPFVGACANFRLAPQDYHHFHSPMACTVRLIVPVPGDDFTTETIALSSQVDVLGMNERTVVVLDGDGISCLFVAVGAEAVGKVRLSVDAGDVLAKGDEMGHFEYGGSDIFLAFDRDIMWSDDVDFHTRQGIETMTKAMETVGYLSFPDT
jgi:phosphatidylserine decarboxylase